MDSNPPPKSNSSRPIWELVIEDMRKRDEIGRERYGTPLQAHNGRDALVDAYEEALDLAVYLRQAIEERATHLSSLETRVAHAEAEHEHLRDQNALLEQELFALRGRRGDAQ